MPKLKDRRTGARISRTIKLSNDFGDFYKLEIFDEGTLTSEEATSEESRAVRDDLFRELHEEALAREAALKAARDRNALDKIVDILKAIFANAEKEHTPEPDPPVEYFSEMDIRAAEEGKE